jgi:hypothetical protein
VSSPSHPQSPVEPAGPTSPSTSEIPVIRPVTAGGRQLPPHPGATAVNAPAVNTPPVPTSEGPQPTGPVDFVPGLPGLGTPPPPPPAPAPAPAAASPVWPETLESELTSAPSPERAPRDRTALVGLGLAVLALVLLQVGLALDFGTESLWSAATLWAAFSTVATLAAVVGLLAFAASAARGGRPAGEPAWRIAAAGLLGLAVFWLLVVLPAADTDRGFLLTAALACLGGALWIGASRKA